MKRGFRGVEGWESRDERAEGPRARGRESRGGRSEIGSQRPEIGGRRSLTTDYTDDTDTGKIRGKKKRWGSLAFLGFIRVIRG